MPDLLTRPARAAAAAGGRLLAGATDLLAEVREPEKPLHPHGQLLRGRLIRYGDGPPSGVRWLDEAADQEALVRTSRAVGTPAPLPDIHGLAVRIPQAPDGFADLLFATTAWNRVGRHVLVPTRGVGTTLTTLLPYRTSAGPVVLGARRVDAVSYELHWAPFGKGWHPLGRLTVELPADPDAVVSFDPVQHHPPGMAHYPWAVRLRERSYATARSHRR